MHTKLPPHSVFTENLVIACLTNTRPGAPAAIKHMSMELRKCRRQDDREDTVYRNDVQQIEHEAMLITKYFETRRVKNRLTRQEKQMSKHSTACCEMQSMSLASQHQMPTTAALSAQME